MAITIGSNIASLGAQRRLGEATERLSKSSERLSSGLRINRASDDAAGLAIASSIASDARVFAQGVRNINDGLSAIAIAEGALTQLRDLSIRQRELAEQAANGTYSLTQRRAMNAEANALVDEWNRITGSTSFNGLNLLDSSLGPVVIQAGSGVNATVAVNVNSELSRPVGDGTFQTANVLAPSGAPRHLLVDINGDSRLDLVDSLHSLNQVDVFLGNGDGTFGARASLATGTTPGGVTAGDFNGDGRTDLVTADFGSGQISLFLGNGNGTFLAARTYAAGNQPYMPESADLNGDGYLDLVTTNPNHDQIGIFLGNGDGSFRARAVLPGSTSPNYTKIGDVNGDGILDLVAQDYYSGTNIHLGKGDGTFAAPLSVAAAYPGYDFALGDLNGDGTLDLIVSEFGNGTGSVLLGHGDGTFRNAGRIAIGTVYASGLTVTDVNGDGRSDLLASDFGGNKLRTLIGNGDGTFRASLDSSFSTPYRSAVGDVNGDGRPDLALVYNSSSIGILLASGARTTTSSYLNINTRQGALDALGTIDGNLQRVVTQLGTLGAASSRLGVALSALQSRADNYVAAASRITDADIAAESADFVRTQILQQAAASILAQANQLPGLALQLLRTS